MLNIVQHAAVCTVRGVQGSTGESPEHPCPGRRTIPEREFCSPKEGTPYGQAETPAMPGHPAIQRAFVLSVKRRLWAKG